jgi:hypothetical protein
MDLFHQCDVQNLSIKFLPIISPTELVRQNIDHRKFHVGIYQ